jgi:RNA polymerase sigma factor (sigma-70 family)
MQRASYYDAVAGVIGLPVKKVLAYINRRKLRPTRQGIRAESARLATIKEGSRWELNDLYDKWRNGSDEERSSLQEQIYKAALKPAKAVMWKELREDDPHFPNDVAAEVVRRTPAFEGRRTSKFSTYAYGIAKKKAIEKKRKIARYKKRFDVNADYEKEIEKTLSYGALDSVDERLFRNELARGLKPEEIALLDGMVEGMSVKELAARLGIRQHAAETRVRRLRSKLREKISHPA